MSKYVLTPEADEDLSGIWEYIAGDNLEAADGWDTKLREAFGMLADNPHAGHTRKDLTDLPVLFWPVGAYLVIYRVLSDCVEILAVTQGARDVPSFLLQRGQ
jgi:plasmid stabilization system protein ParE